MFYFFFKHLHFATNFVQIILAWKMHKTHAVWQTSFSHVSLEGVWDMFYYIIPPTPTISSNYLMANQTTQTRFSSL